MPIPQHTIHIYQRPAQGSSFIKRYATYNYQHTITNQGWFDTASCDIAVHSLDEGQFLINNCLGSFVAIYVDNPCEPIWEGLINRIIFNAGGASYTISLDDMANRVSVVYTGASNVAAETPVADNTNSQAVYGVKQDQIEFGADPSAGTQRTTLANTILLNRAWPQTSLTQAQGEANIVHFELIGVFHTLEWVKFFAATTTATSTATAAITNNLTTNPNAGTFFSSVGTGLIQNNTMTIPQQTRANSYWERFQKIAEAGDGTNYWVIGITPTDFNRQDRRLYYQPANYVTTYIARQADSLRIRNLNGQVISPWLVVPDCVIQVTDSLIGSQQSVNIDPTFTYIQSIQYDANSQQVKWQGADDTTARAAFKLKRGYKAFSSPFGAPVRTIAT